MFLPLIVERGNELLEPSNFQFQLLEVRIWKLRILICLNERRSNFPRSNPQELDLTTM